MRNFKAELLRLARKRHDDLVLKTTPVVLKLKEELVNATPIDTGLARESWSTSKTLKGHDVKNSVEYIEYLNQGSSKQAPARFIEGIALKYGRPLGTIVDVER